jgi:CcmD family protein
MLFFIQDAPLETTNYMIAGYAVIFSVMLVYIFSLAVRNRNLKQDIEVLEEIEQKEAQRELEHTSTN